MKRSPVTLAIVILTASLDVSSVCAADRTWTGAFNNSFTNSANWVGGNVPANNDYQDVAVFNDTAALKTVYLKANREMGGFRIVNSTGWTITGAQYSVGHPIASSGVGTNTFTAGFRVLNKNPTWTIGAGNVLRLRGGINWESSWSKLVGPGTLRIEGGNGAWSDSNPPTVTNGLVELAASTGADRWQVRGVGVSRCFSSVRQVGAFLELDERGLFDCNGYNQTVNYLLFGIGYNTSSSHSTVGGGFLCMSNAIYTVNTALRMKGGTILAKPTDSLRTSGSITAMPFARPSTIGASVVLNNSGGSTISAIVSNGTAAVDLDIAGNLAQIGGITPSTFNKVGVGLARIRGNAYLPSRTIGVLGGTLMVDGAVRVVDVSAGAVFGGSATVSNAVTLAVGAALLPGNDQNASMTFLNGLTLPASASIAVRVGEFTGGAKVAAGSFVMTAPVAVAVTLPDAVADAEYAVLDVTGTAATLSLADFALSGDPDDTVRCRLRLSADGKRLSLRVGIDDRTLILVR